MTDDGASSAARLHSFRLANLASLDDEMGRRDDELRQASVREDRADAKKWSVEIDEIAYGIRLARSGHVQLRWLDKPAKEYVVHHHVDGSIEVRPLGERTYLIRATEDDLLVLKETPAGEDYLDVRHRSDGLICLRTRVQAADHGDIWDRTIEKMGSHPGERSKTYQYIESNLDMFVVTTTCTHPRYPTSSSSRSETIRYTAEYWDRQHKNIRKRPQDLVDLENREQHGEEWLEKWKAKEAERRRYAKAYRAKRKAIDSGLMPPTPRLLKERAKRDARQKSIHASQAECATHG